MTTMIERLARAIYEKRNGVGCRPWSIQTKSHKAPYMDDARAALEAQKGPKSIMVEAGALRWATMDGKRDRFLDDKAGKLSDEDGTYEGYCAEFAELLSAAITAALEEGE